MTKLIYKLHLRYLTSRPLTFRRALRICAVHYKLVRM